MNVGRALRAHGTCKSGLLRQQMGCVLRNYREVMLDVTPKIGALSREKVTFLGVQPHWQEGRSEA